jgi:DNA polymerase III alpha subunit
VRNFVTCHCHPQSLDSASTPKAFVERELQLGTGYVTVTDHGSLAACRQVYDLAREKKITPIIGVEGYFRDDDCPILSAAGIPKQHPKKRNGDLDETKPKGFVDYFKYGHFTVHFLDQNAYELAVRLLSQADARAEQHGSERKPLFGWNEFDQLAAANTTITTGCLIGMVQRHIIQNNNFELAFRYFQRMRAVTRPGQLFVEVFPHDTSKNWVHGVFINVNVGDKQDRIRFYEGKTLRTNKGEIKAKQLADDWAKADHGGHQFLLAVKDWDTWTEREPAQISGVEHIEDFMPNECRPWCPNGDLQAGTNRFMIDLATRFKVPILIGDDSHYATPDEKPVQDVRLMSGGGSWRFYSSYHRQSSAEAFAHFERTLGVREAQFEAWVDNTHAWADSFRSFEFKSEPCLPTKFYPEDTLKHTFTLIRKHGRMRWNDPRYSERLAAEIRLLHENGKIDLLPYFFIDEEVCSLYRGRGLLTGPGRGSAAGLLLTYLLGITHVDPLKFDLSMDRFLTVDRIRSGKLPDIDQDLPNRDLLVDPEKGWLRERFGDHYAQISVDTTLKLRSAVKDVARVTLGHVPPDIEALTRKFANPPQGIDDYKFVFGYEDSGNWVQGSIETDEALRAYVRQYPKQWDTVKKCLGLARQKSRHACAYVIANRPVSHFIPTMTISDVTCTQYTAASVEAVGGLKMDFLVINSLNDIGDAIRLIQSRCGEEVPESLFIEGRGNVPRAHLVPFKGRWYDIWDLPEDQAVFSDVAQGKTETVFQFNTPGAVKWLKAFAHKKSSGNYAIDSIEAMSAFTALDRPGPLDAKVTAPDGSEHNMLIEYAHRARGEAAAESLPVFYELLPETFGVMVYQEQLQRMYQHLTGCSGADAEEFRSNVAKKKMEKVLKAHPVFIEKAGAKIGPDGAKAVWDLFVTWGQYGFNKSHSVCYSVIAYACAWLKHHYPLEWWCSVLRNASKEEINEVFWRHCGHLIDLPDVKLSGSMFEIQNNRIRAPLSLLHGVGEKAHQQLVAGAPYASIDDFCDKIQQRREANATSTTKKKEKTVKTKRIGDDGKPVRVDGKIVYDKTVEVIEVPSKRLGASALNRAVVYKLIVSGAMDSILPHKIQLSDGNEVEATVVDHLALYEKTIARVTGKKVVAVAPEYAHLNQITRYQMRKSILPAYSAPLLPMLIERMYEGITEVRTDQGSRNVYMPTGSYDEEDNYPFVTLPELEAIDNLRPFPSIAVRAAVVAYVEGQRKFTYKKDGEDRNACELILDADGKRLKVVRWPDKSGNLPKKFSVDLKGSITVVLLNKYKEDRPFSIDDIEVAYPALSAGDEEESPLC